MSIKQIGEIKELQATVKDLNERVLALEVEVKRQRGGRPPKKEIKDGKRSETIRA